MFLCCESLTSLDLRSFNTKKVTESTSMFEDCNKLKEKKGVKVTKGKWTLGYKNYITYM